MPIMPTYDEQPERFIRAGTHFEKCWRLHGECAIAQASAFETQIETLKQELARAQQHLDSMRETIATARAEVNEANAEIGRLKVALGTALPYLIRHRDEINADDQRVIWHGATDPLGSPIPESIIIPLLEYQQLNRTSIALASVRDNIRDYYTHQNFPLDHLIRETLGDDQARKLGIVIDEAEETRVAMENGWIER